MQGLYYTKNHVTHRKQIQAGHKQALLQNKPCIESQIWNKKIIWEYIILQVFLPKILVKKHIKGVSFRFWSTEN